MQAESIPSGRCIEPSNQGRLRLLSRFGRGQSAWDARTLTVMPMEPWAERRERKAIPWAAGWLATQANHSAGKSAHPCRSFQGGRPTGETAAAH